MKSCVSCQGQNPDEARFCSQCGATFPAAEAEPAARAAASEEEHWRAFIGQNADRYLEQFRKFSEGATPRFALTWHWPAFLFDPFLWFLYRKMYLYALIYAIGPVVSAYFTGDITVGIVWRIIAAGSANYLYYWHVKEHVAELRKAAGFDQARLERSLHEEGGVQPYVIWVGVALHLLLLALILAAIKEGPPEKGKLPLERGERAAVRLFVASAS
ncbi:MAG: DUF2628 domain-containing protein [Nitrospirota bacterium]